MANVDRIHITWPYVAKRNGLRIIKCGYQSDNRYASPEIITNAYGNGIINTRHPHIPEDIWDKMIVMAKEIELKYIPLME